VNRKIITLVLLVAVCCGYSGCALAKHKQKPPTVPSDATAGDFDYFLLTLSWTPEFCATEPRERPSAECAPSKHVGLLVRGFRPQYDDGKWPQDCGSTSPVPSATVKHMMPIMPGNELIQHEWATHGTCSRLSMQDYFGVIEKLYNALEVPEELKKPGNRSHPSPSVIEQKFALANNAPKRAFRISCPKNQFSAVEICLSKDMQYQACPTTVKECSASRIRVRPLP